MKEISILDFPKKEVVIFLEENFRIKLYQNILKILKTKKEFLKFFNKKSGRFIEAWRYGKIKRNKNWITEQGLVLNDLLKASKFLSKNNLKEFNIENLQKSIIAYKSRGKSLWIKNPILPIKLKPELFRIISHMICDGSALKNTHYYKNTRRELLEQLDKDLKYVFGGVETTFYNNNLIVPNLIFKILTKVFNFKTGTFESRIPKILYKLPKEYSSKFIQAFFDDEGTVATSNLKFYSHNKKLLQDLMGLILLKFKEIKKISDIRERNKIQKSGKLSKEYHFVIGARDIEIYLKLVGSDHCPKLEEIRFILDRQNKCWNHRNKGETKLKIMLSLLEKSKTPKEIARDVFISKDNVGEHLRGYSEERKLNQKGLLKEGFVKIKEQGLYNSHIYELTDKGINYLNNNNSI